MPTQNKRNTENLSLVWTELPIAAATLACAALLFLAVHKTDFAAWMFLAILGAIGASACVFFSLKARKEYISASADEKPKLTLLLSLIATGVTALTFLALFIVTMVQFLLS